MKIINPIKISGATVAFAYSGTTSYIEGILRVVRCKFTTATTIFLVTINDKDGIPIYKSEIQTGELVEQVALGVRGVYTFVISEASENEAFEGRLEIEE
jgi:hypothetical protein